MDEIATIYDVGEAKTKYRELLTLVAEEGPVIPLVWQNVFFAMRSDVFGFAPGTRQGTPARLSLARPVGIQGFGQAPQSLIGYEHGQGIDLASKKRGHAEIGVPPLGVSASPERRRACRTPDSLTRAA